MWTRDIRVGGKLEAVDISAFYDRAAKGLAAAVSQAAMPEVPNPHADTGGLHRPTARNWENKHAEEFHILWQDAIVEAQCVKLLKEAEAKVMDEIPTPSIVWEFHNIVMWPQVRNWGYGPVRCVGQRFDEVSRAK